MIRKGLLLRLFDGAYMQRWNDKLRPTEFTELDKQAHKMVIAYFIGKLEEEHTSLNWHNLIKGGLFEYLQRIVITDIKPPVFYKIKEDKVRYGRLKEFTLKQLDSYLTPLGETIKDEFSSYFQKEEDTIEKKILGAAHNYASKWEFNFIKRLDPDGFEIKDIVDKFNKKLQSYTNELKGFSELMDRIKYQQFIDLCGSLRFQVRWSHVHRIPKTTVLGHSLMVALISYLFSLENNACSKRLFNNYFTGLFHDLPEVLTRDIVSPVKKEIEELEGLIKEIEEEEMRRVVQPLLPDSIYKDICMFTKNEFKNIVFLNGTNKEVDSADITRLYNYDSFNPRDGELVKAADDLSAYIEAYEAIKNGCSDPEFSNATMRISKKYENKTIENTNLGSIYADF